METTLQPSLPSFRSKITTIEAIEFSLLAFLLWGLFALIPTETKLDFVTLLVALVLFESAILGSWVFYLAYIRITRGMYPRLDIRLKFFLAVLTGSYTFWAWIILDINRWIVAKLLYTGDAPVEYAWSSKSKLARKLWEESRKAGQL